MKPIIEGNKIIYEGSEDCPAILMDLESSRLIIEGASFPEDAVVIYEPVIKWLVENENKIEELEVIFDYSILSSASNKMVFEIILKLEKLTIKGKKISIKWYYAAYDEDMFDEGRGFKETLKINMELISKN